MSSELHKLAQAMCSIDLSESHWTQELPRLPVPDLCLTMSRYLSSLKAVLAPSDDQRAHGSARRPSGGQRSESSAPTETASNRDTKEAEEERREQDERRRQFEHAERLVRQFMVNEGPQLQRDLKEYANKCQNWATEYWLQDMYLSNPLPLPVNSNPFFMFPRQRFASSEQMLMFATRIIQFSVDFKYRIDHRKRNRLCVNDRQTLRQDFGSGHGKGKPLCMETYKNFFHSYRMPHEDMDRLLPQSRRSNHIVVVSCNQFYILRLGQDPLDDPYRKDASMQLNEASIYDQLLRIYRVSREHAKRGEHSLPSSGGRHTIPKVGLFTTENRKTWARLHRRLIHCNAGASQAVGGSEMVGAPNGSSGSCSPNTNTESLRQIEDCLFVMCLDSLVSSSSSSSSSSSNNTSSSSSNNNNHVGQKCKSQDQNEQRSPYEEVDGETDVRAASIILTGGGTRLFTANRWFDKFLQIIVGRDGICGINIEHSASEGITVLRFLEDFLEFIKMNPIDRIQSSSSSNQFDYGQTIVPSASAEQNNSSITSPAYVEPKSPSALLEESDKITPLMWQLDRELLEAIDEAESNANRLVENFSLKILLFTQFGRTYIKSQNLSPDAFIQLALQYTFFKIHNCLVSTYESASLRQFRLGRVDNIRANTCEAHDWIQDMVRCRSTGDGPVDWKGAEESFNRAITKQVEILRYTIFGKGPDNHLLALKQLAQIRYDSDDLPELFTDTTYKEFLNFRLSTSQLPNESGITVGYGAVTPDGYGCSYNPCPNRIIFCVSSFADCPQTSSSKFASILEESLLEMQQLCSIRTQAQRSHNI